MLDFTVGNYRSFHAKKTISLLAQKLKEDEKANVSKVSSYEVLKTLAVYGANSSGKSNLIKALLTMKDRVVDSVRLNDEDELLYDPFLLLKDVHEPTLFEITFRQDSFYYRYGFRYYKATIEDEWLFRKTTSRSKEHELFIRNMRTASPSMKRNTQKETSGTMSS